MSNFISDTVAEKRALRSQMRQLRQAFLESQSLLCSREICVIGQQIFSRKRTPVLSFFVPYDGEPNLFPLAQKLHDSGFQLCLPVVQGKEKPLIFRRWTPSVPLTKQAYGIAAPGEKEEVLLPDLLLVPLLAFDAKGYRLGYGGGYYDRTIVQLRNLKSILSIGVAFSAQEVVAVPREEHDVPLDFVLTEFGHRAFTELSEIPEPIGKTG